MSTAATSVLQKTRYRGRKRKRGRLPSVLRGAKILVFRDVSVEEYKRSKVAESKKSYQKLSTEVKRYETWLERLRIIFTMVRNVSLASVVACGIVFASGACLCVLGVKTPWLAVLGREILQAALVGLSSTVLGSIALFVVYTLFMEVCMLDKARERLKSKVVSHSEIAWECEQLDFYEACYGFIPLAARALVRRIREGLPEAEFFVDYTRPVKLVELDTKAWQNVREVYTPDPFLVVRYGGSTYTIFAWNEEGHEIPSALI